MPPGWLAPAPPRSPPDRPRTAPRPVPGPPGSFFSFAMPHVWGACWQNDTVRLAARQVEVIGDGICDACVLLFWERHRPEEQQSAPWMARQRRKVDGGLRALAALAEERNGGRDWLVGDRFGLADIVAGTVLGYLDVRFPEHPWRSLHPVLVRLGRPLGRDAPPSGKRSRSRKGSPIAWSDPPGAGRATSCSAFACLLLRDAGRLTFRRGRAEKRDFSPALFNRTGT